MFMRLLEFVKKTCIKFTSFFRDHCREILSFCIGFLIACGLFYITSCRGSWKLDNETKVNGVGVSTHICYTDSTDGGENSNEEVQE